jgi:hypothetical protein
MQVYESLIVQQRVHGCASVVNMVGLDTPQIMSWFLEMAIQKLVADDQLSGSQIGCAAQGW